jgi:hypothetical protein
MGIVLYSQHVWLMHRATAQQLEHSRAVSREHYAMQLQTMCSHVPVERRVNWPGNAMA